MIELIKQKALEQGIKLAAVPVECILDVKDDMEKLISKNLLNRRLKWIEEEKYNFRDYPFQPKSIVTAVWKLSLAELTVNYKGKQRSTIVSDIYYPTTKTQSLLNDLFGEQGFSLEYVYWIPHKSFAVRNGLCEYGRNNITYSNELGSFIRIEVYISDAPVESYVWRDMITMALCDSCKKCIENCPTEAIIPDRFVINSKYCLSYLTCEDCDLPEWVPKPAPYRLVECLYCQDICPMNNGRLKNIEHIEFDEIETEIMIKSDSYSDFPDKIKKKFWHYNNSEPYTCIPRNLRLLVEKI